MSKMESGSRLLGSGLLLLALLVAIFLPTIVGSHLLFFVGAAAFLALTILAARLAAAARRVPHRSVSDARHDAP